MSILASQVVAQWGAYYINQGQAMKDLRTKIYQPSETATLFPLRITENTKEKGVNTRLGRIVQPFQKAWTPVGDITFEPVEIDLFKIKINESEYPDDLEASYVGFLAGPGIDRKQWPFVKWYIEQHLLPRREEDWENYEVFRGIFAAPTPGVAGPAGTSINGIKKIINTHIASGKTVPISIGTPDADPKTWCTQVESFVKQINRLYRKMPMTLAMSDDLYTRYKDGKRAKYNMYYAQESDLETVTNYPNIRVFSSAAMTADNSKKIWCTPAFNAVRLQKRPTNNILVENVDINLKFYTDWMEGYGFWFRELIFTNAEDLTSTTISSEG